MSREEFEKEIDDITEDLKEKLFKKLFNSTDSDKSEKTLEETIGFLDKYYFIHIFETVCSETCRYNNDDKRLFEIGNFYLTKEEAEFEVERRKVIRELKRYAVKNPVWDKDCEYFVISYDFNFKLIGHYVVYAPISDILFESRDLLNKAVGEVGEDRVKKYYLMVED